MKYGMWIHEIHGTPVNEWLATFDIEYAGGVGVFTSTPDPQQAYPFDSLADVVSAWKRVSSTMPVRPDGKPNRPLSALTISPQVIPGRD